MSNPVPVLIIAKATLSAQLTIYNNGKNGEKNTQKMQQFFCYATQFLAWRILAKVVFALFP